MRAMILAAGRGERMRPLTDRTPKPLLCVGGRPLIEHHLRKLAQRGIRQVVVNVSHLAEQLVAFLGDGSAWGLKLTVLTEPPGALETGGGIHNALPHLGDEPFLVVNGDVWCELDIPGLRSLALGDKAHLLLVDNPDHHPDGDFTLAGERVVPNRDGKRLTFAGISLLHPGLFANCRPGAFPLAPLLHEAVIERQVSGSHFHGDWLDVGTPARLHELDQRLSAEGTEPSRD